MAYDANTVIEMKAEYLVNTQRCFNVFHFVPDGNSVGFLKQDMIAGLLALETGLGNGVLVGELRKILASMNVAITSVSAQIVYPVRYRAITQFLSVAGTNVGTCDAQNVQACITKKGELAKRSNIGSVRIGGLGTNQYASGLISVGLKAKLQTFVDDWLLIDKSDGLSTVAYRPAILNRTPAIVDGKTKFFISGGTPFDQAEVHDQLRTQRTRTVGHGF